MCVFVDLLSPGVPSSVMLHPPVSTVLSQFSSNRELPHHTQAYRAHFPHLPISLSDRFFRTKSELARDKDWKEARKSDAKEVRKIDAKEAGNIDARPIDQSWSLEVRLIWSPPVKLGRRSLPNLTGEGQIRQTRFA